MRIPTPVKTQWTQIYPARWLVVVDDSPMFAELEGPPGPGGGAV